MGKAFRPRLALWMHGIPQTHALPMNLTKCLSSRGTEEHLAPLHAPAGLTPYPLWHWLPSVLPAHCLGCTALHTLNHSSLGSS